MSLFEWYSSVAFILFETHYSKYNNVISGCCAGVANGLAISSFPFDWIRIVANGNATHNAHMLRNIQDNLDF